MQGAQRMIKAVGFQTGNPGTSIIDNDFYLYFYEDHFCCTTKKSWWISEVRDKDAVEVLHCSTYAWHARLTFSSYFIIEFIGAIRLRFILIWFFNQFVLFLSFT